MLCGMLSRSLIALNPSFACAGHILRTASGRSNKQLVALYNTKAAIVKFDTGMGEYMPHVRRYGRLNCPN